MFTHIRGPMLNSVHAAAPPGYVRGVKGHDSDKEAPW